MKNLRINWFLTAAATLAFAAGLAFSACRPDDPYRPAEPVSDDVWGVYFSSENTSEFVRDTTDEPVLELTLCRTRTQGALDVPLEISRVEGVVSAPESAHFDDGQTETLIQITYRDMATQLPRCRVSVPESYANPYTQTPGMYYQDIAVITTVQLPVYWCTSFYSGDKNIFDQLTGRITQVAGENRFYFIDFLGSGVNLAFKFDVENGGVFDSQDFRNCAGPLVPLDHYADDGEYGWELTSDAKGRNVHAWTPEGAEQGVESSFFVYYVYEGASYFYLDFWDDTYQCGVGDMWAVVIDNSDTYNNYYIYVYYE